MMYRRWVLKNTKTGEFSDGNYGWSMKINDARLYSCPGKPGGQHEDHIHYVEVELKEKIVEA